MFPKAARVQHSSFFIPSYNFPFCISPLFLSFSLLFSPSYISHIDLHTLSAGVPVPNSSSQIAMAKVTQETSQVLTVHCGSRSLKAKGTACLSLQYMCRSCTCSPALFLLCADLAGYIYCTCTISKYKANHTFHSFLHFISILES